MSNLIEREKAIRAIAADLMANAILKSADASDNIRDWIPMAEDILSIVPTVDAVPVVRCKDCKHNPKLEWLGCPMASLNEKQRPETAWCWKGEQKDGEANENR